MNPYTSLKLITGMLLALVILLFFVLTTSNDFLSANFLPKITPIIILLGVTVALTNMLSSVARDASKEHLESALTLLEQAYNTLNKIDPNTGLPPNSRMNWLNAARLIQVGLDLSIKISEQTHKDIWARQLEYWRAMFYDLLHPNPPQGLPKDYFVEKPKHWYMHTSEDREPIAESSVAYLYRFVMLSKGAEFDDPIKDEKGFSEQEIKRMSSFGPQNLGDSLTEGREWHENSKKS